MDEGPAWPCCMTNGAFSQCPAVSLEYREFYGIIGLPALGYCVRAVVAACTIDSTMPHRLPIEGFIQCVSASMTVCVVTSRFVQPGAGILTHSVHCSMAGCAVNTEV